MKTYFSGGIFFALILRALKPVSEETESYIEDPKYPSTLLVMEDLMKVVLLNDNIVLTTTFKKNVSEYKTCKYNGGNNIPFNDSATLHAFDNGIKKNYQSYRNKMVAFLDEYIDINKVGWLIDKCLKLLCMDNNTNTEHLFFVLPSGNSVKYTDIFSMNKIDYPSFLLGVLHFILLNRQNNICGREAYMEIFQGGEEFVRDYFDESVFVKKTFDFEITHNEKKCADITVVTKTVARNLPSFDFSHYNVVVLNTLKLQANSTGRVLIDRSRVMCEDMMPELIDEFSDLTPTAIEKLKTYPVLFTHEKTRGFECEGQIVTIGRITDVVIQDNGVKIYYEMYEELPLQSILYAYKEFGFGDHININTLTRTHWVLRRINLKETLEDEQIEVSIW